MSLSKRSSYDEKHLHRKTFVDASIVQIKANCKPYVYFTSGILGFLPLNDKYIKYYILRH